MSTSPRQSPAGSARPEGDPLSVRERLHRFIHHPVIDASIMAMIVVSVALLVVELTVQSEAIQHLAIELGHGLTIVFIAELLLRFYVARSKTRFFRQYWLDILAVIPWMRSLRLLRLLRLLRIFRMGLLLTRRLRNISSVFQGVAGEALIMMMIIVIIVLAGAIGIQVTEGHHADFKTLEQGVWWALMTLIAGEPIGGEASTTAGRVLTTVMMLGGLTLFAMFTGIVSAVMVNRLRNLNVRTMEIEELRHHIVICGWNRSGKTILKELSKAPEQVQRGIVIVAEFQADPDLGEHGLDPELLFVVRGDYTQLEILKRCGIPFADRALLLADDTRERQSQDVDARTVLAAIAIERMNPDIFSSVELLNRDNGAHLKVMGVEEIVVGDEYAGTLIAMGLRNRGISALIHELMSVGVGNQFFKLPMPRALLGKDVDTVARTLRVEHKAILVAIESINTEGGRNHVTNPPGDLVPRADDLLVVISRRAPSFPK